MSWVAPAISAAAAVASTAMDAMKKGQASAGAAGQNTALQDYLTFRGMNLQEQMAKAGKTDVYGNQVIFDPNTNSWVTLTSPQGQALINRSDAIQRQQDVANLTTGPDERTLALNRRLAAGGGADQLLTEFNRRYGAPTKEGVIGGENVAAATAASEAADQARSGYTAAALRTGMGSQPLESTMASLDRGATSGLRTALASNKLPIYNEMLANYQASKLNPHGTLAGEASAPNIPFTPSALPTTLGSDLTQSAAMGTRAWNPYTGYASNAANKSLIDAMQSDYGRKPDYGQLTGGLTRTLQGIYGDYMKQNYPTLPDPTITKTGSSPF